MRTFFRRGEVSILFGLFSMIVALSWVGINAGADPEAASVVQVSDRVTGFVVTNPGPAIAFVGLFVPLLLYFLARRDRQLQRRRVYMDLEFESARIFRTCIDRPEIIRYLEGDAIDGDPASKPSGESDAQLRDRAYWYVCQVLNSFELMISLFKEGMVQIDIFSTWVSWFHEVGTAARFDEFWDGRGLSFHYKAELQQIMDLAQDLRKSRSGNFSFDDELDIFYRKAADICDDPEIWEHFKWSQRAKAQRAARWAALSPERSSTSEPTARSA